LTPLLGLLNYKHMANKQTDKNIKLKDIEKLLNNQTTVILSAVDEKLSKTDSKMAIMEVRLVSTIDEKIKQSEERINRKIDKLTTTIDKFLVRLTRMEDEFEIMKFDINRLKKVVGEKLGVDLT
jgi:molybdopterin converting factor small subunit